MLSFSVEVLTGNPVPGRRIILPGAGAFQCMAAPSETNPAVYFLHRRGLLV
jgi:hypothetical protein